MGNAETLTPQAEWHYELDGVRTGPATEAEIVGLIAAKKLGRSSFLWRKGLTDWTALESTTFGQHFSDSPPPLTGAAVSNTVVWWLALAPLVGVFVAGLLAGATGKDIGKFWWVTLVLNIALSMADEKKLKQAGHDTAQMGPSFFVPVYLFKRAKILKQSNSYFIVWLVLFTLSLFSDF
jgi:hypothetical protein